MNACLFSTAFKSSSLFLIKTESTLQIVKVDFFSNKLRLALDTLIGLGFAVASERVFFPGLAEVFFRLGVGFLLFIGSAVGVENSALDISRMSVELLGISGGGRLWEAEYSEKRRVEEGRGDERFVGDEKFVGDERFVGNERFDHQKVYELQVQIEEREIKERTEEEISGKIGKVVEEERREKQEKKNTLWVYRRFKKEMKEEYYSGSLE